MAIDNSDGVIIGSPKINAEVEKYLKKSGKPMLNYISHEDEYIDAYSEFYDTVFEEVAEMID